MQNPSFFQRLIFPFYKADYYRAVVDSGQGFGFKRMFGVLTLNWFLTLVILVVIGWLRYPDINSFYQNLLRQWPTVTIAGGKASADVEMPYIIPIPETTLPFVVIDTTDAPQLSGDLLMAPVVITQRQVTIKNESQNNARTYYFAEAADSVLDQSVIDGIFKTVTLLMVPFTIVLMMLVSYPFRLLQVFVYGGFGNIFNAIFQKQLSYDQLCRIAATALTPVLLADVVLFFKWSGPKLWFFNFFLVMIFMGYGVSAQKKPPLQAAG